MPMAHPRLNIPHLGRGAFLEKLLVSCLVPQPPLEVGVDSGVCASKRVEREDPASNRQKTRGFVTH